MTSGIILTLDIITVTSLCHCPMARRQLDTWQNFIFLKNSKNKKIEELTCGTPFNAVTVPLTKRTKLISNFPKQIPNWDEK